jgi:hypothetical protein
MKPYSFEKIGVTQGILATFMECRQKAKLKLQRWEQKGGGISGALEYGIRFHQVLEEIHKWQMRNSHKQPKASLVEFVVKDVFKRWKKQLRGERLRDKDEQEVELIHAQITAVAPAYYRFHKENEYKWTDAEGVFDIPYSFTGGNTRLRGRIDGVYQVGKNLGLLDTKTKTQIQEEHYGEVLLRNWQINFYMLATSILTSLIPAEFTYDVVRRPSLKLGASEGLDAYVARVLEHIDKEGPEHYFKQYTVAIIKSDLMAFKKELDALLVQFSEWVRSGMPSPLFGMPCVAKFGLCEFVGMDFNHDRKGYQKRESYFPELEN